MVSKQASDSASSTSKKPKVYCHFKSSWKTQEFSVPLGDQPGVQRMVTVSGNVLSGVDEMITPNVNSVESHFQSVMVEPMTLLNISLAKITYN